MSARNMAKRTAAGTLALAVCLGGGALALAGAARAAQGELDRWQQREDHHGPASLAERSEQLRATDGSSGR